MTKLAEFRKQYPQYDDMDDESLLDAFYDKYYSDLDYDEYREKMGFAAPPPPPKPKPLSIKLNEKIDRAMTANYGLFSPKRQGLADFKLDEETISKAEQSRQDRLQRYEEAPKARLSDLFRQGWNNFRTARLTAKGVGIGESYKKAEDYALGRDTAVFAGGPTGLPTAQLQRINRARAAQAGDPAAKAAIEQEVQTQRAGLIANLQEVLDKSAEIEARTSDVQPSLATQELTQARTLTEALQALESDPIRIIAETAAQSFPQMGEAIILGTLGGAVAGPIGMGAGLGAGSAQVEYRNELMNGLRQAGVDLTDAESVITALENEPMMQAIRSKALKRAGIIGAFDAGSGFLSSKVLAPAMKSHIARELTNVGAQQVSQAALGGGGEAAAQLATEGKVSIGEVFQEALGEAALAPVEVGAATISGARQGGRIRKIHQMVADATAHSKKIAEVQDEATPETPPFAEIPPEEAPPAPPMPEEPEPAGAPPDTPDQPETPPAPVEPEPAPKPRPFSLKGALSDPNERTQVGQMLALLNAHLDDRIGGPPPVWFEEIAESAQPVVDDLEKLDALRSKLLLYGTPEAAALEPDDRYILAKLFDIKSRVKDYLAVKDEPAPPQGGPTGEEPPVEAPPDDLPTEPTQSELDDLLDMPKFRQIFAAMADEIADYEGDAPAWQLAIEDDPSFHMRPIDLPDVFEKRLRGDDLGEAEGASLNYILNEAYRRLTNTFPDALPKWRSKMQQMRAQVQKMRDQESLPSPPGLDGARLPAAAYAPDMTAAARILFETMDRASEAGISDARIDALIKNAPNEMAAMRKLERMIHAEESQRRATALAAVEGTQEAKPAESGEPARDRELSAAVSKEEAENFEAQFRDELTGLPNERAFALEKDIWSHTAKLKPEAYEYAKAKLHPDAADAIMVATAEAARQLDVRAFRTAEGEITVAADNEADLNAAVELAEAILEKQDIYSPGGGVEGIRVSVNGRPSKRKGRASPALKTDRNADVDLNQGKNNVPALFRSGAGAVPMNADNNVVLGNGRTVRIPKKPISPHTLIRRLQKEFGVQIYKGRIKGKTTLGFYRHARGSGGITIKYANDFETAAHELAHWLDDRYPWIFQLYKQYRAELLHVSYDDKLIHEGYAEFMRLFFTQDEQARRVAPGFYDAWLEVLATNKSNLKNVVFDLQELMHAWRFQGALARLKGKHGNPFTPLPFWEHVQKLRPVQGFKQWALDGLNRVKEIGKITDDPRVMEAYHKLRLAVGGFNSVMDATFFFGTPGVRADGQGFEFTGKALEKIFGKWWNNDEMAAYMIAMRGSELMAQGRENFLTFDEIQAGLALADKHPEFKEIFAEYQAFNQRMLDFYESLGILNADTRKVIEESNQNYVPFHRVLTDSLGVTREAHTDINNPWKRLRGGRHNIKNVFESIIQNNALLIRMAMVNDGKRTLYKALSKHSGSNLRTGKRGSEPPEVYQARGKFITAIPKESRPEQIHKDEVIKRMLEANGISRVTWQLWKQGLTPPNPDIANVLRVIESTADGLADMVQFWKHQLDPMGQNLDYYMDDGKKVWFEIGDPALMDTINFMGPRGYNWLINIFGGFSATLRRGVVATPVFQIKNFERDVMNAWLLSDHTKVPAVRAIRHALRNLDNNPTYQEMLLNGGGFANRAQGMQTHRKLVLNPAQWISKYDRFMGRFENAARLAEFQAARENGVGPRTAALLSRDISTDFAMRGSSHVIQGLAIAVPFLNARVQGLYRLSRQFGSRERIISLAMRGGMLATATLALYAINNSEEYEERYKAFPKDVRDLYWIFFTGPGEDDYFKVPKPFESGMLFATIPERIMEYTRERDGKQFTDAISWMMLQTFNLDMTPQVFQPWVELAANKKYTGAPIVPLHLENVAPTDQYTFYTTETAIAFGRATGLSPLKVDHVLRGYTATLGTYFLAVSDAIVRQLGDPLDYGERPARGETWKESILAKVLIDPAVSEGPLRRTSHQQSLWELIKESERLANTVALRIKRHQTSVEDILDDPRQLALYGMSQSGVIREIRDANSQIRRAIELTRMDKTLSAHEKRERIWELMRQSNLLAREANEMLAEGVAKAEAEARAAAQ